MLGEDHGIIKKTTNRNNNTSPVIMRGYTFGFFGSTKTAFPYLRHPRVEEPPSCFEVCKARQS